MKKSAGLLGLISTLIISVASADGNCTYKFAAPATSIEPGHNYVTYFVQDVKTYQTKALKIGSGAVATITNAPCEPYVIYATYSKSHTKVRSDRFICPSHSIYFSIQPAKFSNPNHQLIVVNKNIEIKDKSYQWKKMQNCQPADTAT